MSDQEPLVRETWRQIALVMDGRQVPIGAGALLIVDGEDYSVTVDDRVVQRGTIRSNYAVVPWESDVTITEGDQAGDEFSQIFLIAGDVLISCASSGGAPRPTEFASQSGTGHVLSVWLRGDIARAETGFQTLLSKLFPFMTTIVLAAVSMAPGLPL